MIEIISRVMGMITVIFPFITFAISIVYSFQEKMEKATHYLLWTVFFQQLIIMSRSY